MNSLHTLAATFGRHPQRFFALDGTPPPETPDPEKACWEYGGIKPETLETSGDDWKVTCQNGTACHGTAGMMPTCGFPSAAPQKGIRISPGLLYAKGGPATRSTTPKTDPATTTPPTGTTPAAEPAPAEEPFWTPGKVILAGIAVGAAAIGGFMLLGGSGDAEAARASNPDSEGRWLLQGNGSPLSSTQKKGLERFLTTSRSDWLRKRGTAEEHIQDVIDLCADRGFVSDHWTYIKGIVQSWILSGSATIGKGQHLGSAHAIVEYLASGRAPPRKSPVDPSEDEILHVEEMFARLGSRATQASLIGITADTTDAMLDEMARLWDRERMIFLTDGTYLEVDGAPLHVLREYLGKLRDDAPIVHASEWFAPLGSRETQARLLGITADTTDAKLDGMARWWEDEGVIVLKNDNELWVDGSPIRGLREYLGKLRDYAPPR